MLVQGCKLWPEVLPEWSMKMNPAAVPWYLTEQSNSLMEFGGGGSHKVRMKE